jgi:dTDP-4-dehydrorhamnose reductase
MAQPKNLTLLLGASGFLGQYFARYLGDNCIYHTSGSSKTNIPTNAATMKINNEQDVIRIFADYNFSRVINCIAMADIEECEKHQDESHWLNSEFPEILARLSFERNKQLIHISTDAIFNGNSAPYRESDEYSPISVYGKTKRDGELNVLAHNKSAQIHRVNFFGTNPKGKSLFDYFYKNLATGNITKGFTDIKFSTMYAEDTARNSIQLANSAKPGVYHVVGDQSISKYEFGLTIALEMGIDKSQIHPASINILPGANLRSKNLTLENSKMKSYGGFAPRIEIGIRKLVEMRRNET